MTAPAWTSSWYPVVPATRHVEVIAEKLAWRADVVDLRYRRNAALALHVIGDDDLCAVCRVPSQCPTVAALTTPMDVMSRVKVAREMAVRPLTMETIRAAVAEADPRVEDRAPR